MLIPILVAIIVVSLCVVLIMLFLSIKSKRGKVSQNGNAPTYRKGKNAAIKEFEKKFYDVVDSTFKQLEQRSGVDRAANQALCRKIKKLEANKEKLESKN